MGFSLQPQDITAFGLLFVIICLLLARAVHAKWNKKNGKRPPELSGQWRIIGHLHLLGADKLLHRKFGEMADEYDQSFVSVLASKKLCWLVAGK